MARTEVRKECPSCGLGVPLDEKTCEFCGWNFDEEDEWISQINKLEQELITEKQKFDDTSVDKMIKSTLRQPGGEKGEMGEETPLTAQVVRMKKIIQTRPQIQVDGSPPAANESTAAITAIETNPVKVSSGPIVSKPKSFKIDVAEHSAPKDLNLDLKIEESKNAPEPKDEPIAVAEKPADVEPPAQIRSEVVAPMAQATQGKVVRRVVSHGGQPKPMMAQGEARKAVPTKAATPTVAQQKPTPEKPKMPVTAAKPAIIPEEKDEKKFRFGGFGKMFSDKKEEKAHHSAPEKLHQPQSKEPVKPTIKVFICPLCNKEVFETETKCSSCGAEFE